MRNVRAKLVHCHEIWFFNYAKAKSVVKAKATPERAGDVWTWTALDSQSKMILSLPDTSQKRGYSPCLH